MNQVDTLVRGSLHSSSESGQSSLSVLWIADGRQEEGLERAVSRVQGIEVTRVTSERVQERLGVASWDVLWVSRLGLEQPVTSFLHELQVLAGRKPILLLLGGEKVDRVPAGVEVILCHAGVTGFRLAHATHHARHRATLQPEGTARAIPEARSVIRTPQGGASTVVKKAHGGGSLRDALPTTFEELVTDYLAVLDLAVRGDQVTSDLTITDGLQKLAIHLGCMEAESGDVIQIHSTGMIRKFDQLCAEEARRAMEVGNRLVLELMGHLVSYYRTNGSSSDVPDCDGGCAYARA